MEPVRRYLTLSNVLASLALFVALGGSAYAVSAQSVGTKELQNRAVTAAKIRDGAVTAPKIRANSVNARKIRNGAVRRNKIANGAIGPGKIAAGAIDRSKLNLSELGVLPAADRATTAQQADKARTAESAETAKKADRATNSDTAGSATTAERALTSGTAQKATMADSVADLNTFSYRMVTGMIRTLANNGDVSVRAGCVTSAGQQVLRIYGHTTSNRAVLLSTETELSGGASESDFLNAGMPETAGLMEFTGSTHTHVEQTGSGLIMDQEGNGLLFASGDIAMTVNHSGVGCIVTGVIRNFG